MTADTPPTEEAKAAPTATDVEEARGAPTLQETPRTSMESGGGASALSRTSRQPSLMRPSVNAWMRTSGDAGGRMHRQSVAGFRAQIANESLARMSYTPAGWKADDTAELIDVC